VHGNDGIDTAVFTGPASAATIIWNGATATVTTVGGGTDTIDHVGVLQFADHKLLLVGRRGDYPRSRRRSMLPPRADTILIANGTYNGTSRSERRQPDRREPARRVINGTMSTPASFDDTTSRTWTSTMSGNGMLLDMRARRRSRQRVRPRDLQPVRRLHGEVPIGTGKCGLDALHSNDLDGVGLAFQHVTMASNNQAFPASVAFVYTTIHSVGGGKMLLDDVTLSGTGFGTSTASARSGNMTPNGGAARRSVSIISRTPRPGTSCLRRRVRLIDPRRSTASPPLGRHVPLRAEPVDVPGSRSRQRDIVKAASWRRRRLWMVRVDERDRGREGLVVARHRDVLEREADASRSFECSAIEPATWPFPIGTSPMKRRKAEVTWSNTLFGDLRRALHVEPACRCRHCGRSCS